MIIVVDPLPPNIESRSESTISLKWDSVKFCGVDVAVVADSVNYIVEGCEGQQWRGGMASKFVSDLSASEYKVLAKGPQLEGVAIEDLKPAQWYHFRVTIEYAGTCVTSTPRAFCTLCSPPDKPVEPYVYLIMNENAMFTNRSRSQPQVRLTWGPPACNGSQIVKYHVQIQEYYDQSTSKPGLSSASRFESTADKNLTGSAACKELYPEKWRTVYCNLVQAVLLEAPRPGCRAWGIRLRALNSSGWSEFSDPLILDSRSHLNLFNNEMSDAAGLNSKASPKLPPLQKTTTPHTRTPPKPKNDGSRRSFEPNESNTFHGDGMDMWSAGPLDTTELQKASSLEEMDDRKDGNVARAQTAPSVSYEQPRCKTPSMLLPQNHRTSVKVGTASAVDSALLSNRSQASGNRKSGSSEDCGTELLEREIDRYFILSSFPS